MDRTVHLTFRYVEHDIVRAMRAHYASRLRLPLDVFAIMVLVVAGAYFKDTMVWLSTACFGLAALFALILIAAFAIIPRLAFRRESKYRDEYSLEFSSAGIRFRTASIDSQLQWSLYSRVLIDAYSYLLYYGTNQFTVIPKRVLENVDRQGQFEDLLTTHVSDIARRG